MRGRGTGDRVLSRRRASGEPKPNQHNHNACQCGLFNHRCRTYLQTSPMQPPRAVKSNRQTTHRAYAYKSAFFARLSWSAPLRALKYEFSIPSGQSSFPRRRERMTDVGSELRYLSFVVRLVWILLRRLLEVTHRRKAATRLPKQASHTTQNVYSRSRTY